MSGFGKILIQSCLVAALSFAFVGNAEEKKPIHCYVGGTMRPVMEKIAQSYELRTGRKIELDHGDSGANMIKAEMSGAGDLYVAHDPFHDVMMAKGLATKGWLAAYIHPVIVVPKGNPKNISGLRSLKNDNLRIVLTDRIYSTMGYLVSAMLSKAGIEDAVERNVVNRPRSGGEAANAVMLGHADAALVWDAVAFLRRKDLDVIEIEKDLQLRPGIDGITGATYSVIKGNERKSLEMPRMDFGHTRVTVDLLKSSSNPAAEDFAKFIVSDEMAVFWKDFAFSMPDSKTKEDFERQQNSQSKTDLLGGEILLYAGAGLQPVISEMAEIFRKKTGVVVHCDFGGSGMILTRLKLAQRGDLFIPGDTWYVELAQQEDLVSETAGVCYFVPVILVQEGNPKGIKDISDIARPGIRLGLGNPKSCQVGRLSEELIAKNKLDKTAVEKNLLFSSATVNELGIQMQTGHLDAVIVWDATAQYYSKGTVIVPIAPEKNIIAVVAAALLKSSTNRAAAKAFLDFITSESGQDILRKHKYTTIKPQEM